MIPRLQDCKVRDTTAINKSGYGGRGLTDLRINYTSHIVWSRPFKVIDDPRSMAWRDSAYARPANNQNRNLSTELQLTLDTSALERSRPWLTITKEIIRARGDMILRPWSYTSGSVPQTVEHGPVGRQVVKMFKDHNTRAETLSDVLLY